MESESANSALYIVGESRDFLLEEAKLDTSGEDILFGIFYIKMNVLIDERVLVELNECLINDRL